MKSIDFGVFDLTLSLISTIPSNETTGKLFYLLSPFSHPPKWGELSVAMTAKLKNTGEGIWRIFFKP